MFSNHINKTSFLLTFLTLLVLPSVFLVSQANQSTNLPEIKIKPTKCVSLQQEQACFVNVIITWRVRGNGDYCLSSSQQENPLQCWSSIQQGTFSQEIKMERDITYTLTDKVTNKKIVSADLRLAWVYKKEKFSHSSWRLF